MSERKELHLLTELWGTQRPGALERRALAYRISVLLLTEPIGTRVRLGNAVLEHIPRSLSATLDDPTEDGYVIKRDSLDFDRNNWLERLMIAANPGGIDRGYCEWDISLIPDDATITKTVFKYHGYEHLDDSDAHIHEMVGQRPSTSTDQEVYDEAGEGTVYADPDGFVVVGTGQEVDLGALANADLQSQLTLDWFAIGMQLDNEPYVAENKASQLYTEDKDPAAEPKPTLYVEYTLPAVGRSFGFIIG